MSARAEKDHHKRLKREARARMALVERVLCELDPYSLLAGGAPADEYSPEAALIAARWKDGMSLEALATAIESVWTAQFDPGSAAAFAPVIAERLIAAGSPD